MKVLSAEFVTSAIPGPAGAGIPRDGLPQVAMAGRSNVGKSTLINALGRRTIARTSAAPGKTRLANYYRLTLDGGRGRWSLYLVDLPGYGYARGARSPRGAPKPSATGTDAAAELRAIAEGYFAASSGGYGPAGPAMALLVVDARHPGLELDRQAARWLESIDVRFCLVATKVDKLSRSERARNLKALENTFGMTPLAVSASSGEGLDALWKTIVSLVRTGRA